MSPATSSAQSVNERARKDEIFSVPADDPEMARAFRKARERPDEFLEVAKAPPPNPPRFRRQDRRHKAIVWNFFWIAPFAQKGRFVFRAGSTTSLGR